jgi:adenosylmethionine-8-amino-7-oxononanoate aminotransferase
MRRIAKLDHQYVWHPFTQMRDWLKQEPIVITKGKGATLTDADGRDYLDANSSIWTNLHGHNHPRINRAIRAQLDKIAHSSALGFANEPASLLAEKLVQAANPKLPRARFKNPRLQKVFFSDDGSTAMEAAMKLSYEFTRRSGLSKRPRFLSLEGAYHGDTVGAVSAGHIDLFHSAFSQMLFKTDKVMAPYCYRCPHNQAQPERADARNYRKCNWECVDKVESQFAKRAKSTRPITAMIVEPRVQGAAGVIPQPAGWLKRVAEIARGHGAQLIADEVMTGFGRTGGLLPGRNPQPGPLFASHVEGVQPDFLCVAKGLTGGYTPQAATLTTQEVFDVFLGEYSEFKSFFHGHSFTGNQIGSAAGIASMELLNTQTSIRARERLERQFSKELQSLWSQENVGDVRQVGLLAGIELVKDWQTRKPFELADKAGIRVCDAMAARGVLTRPIGNVIMLMPPYCTTAKQLSKMVAALRESIDEIAGR